MEEPNEVLDLLKSGNFTIAFHDKHICCLYKGKHEYDDLPTEEDYSFDDEYFDGYTPEIIYRLVQALKGKSVSI